RARGCLLRRRAVDRLGRVQRGELLAVAAAPTALLCVRADGADDGVSVTHTVLAHRVDRDVHVRRPRVVASGADEGGVGVREVEDARNRGLLRLRLVTLLLLAVLATILMVATIAVAVVAVPVVAVVAAVSPATVPTVAAVTTPTSLVVIAAVVVTVIAAVLPLVVARVLFLLLAGVVLWLLGGRAPVLLIIATVGLLAFAVFTALVALAALLSLLLGLLFGPVAGYSAATLASVLDGCHKVSFAQFRRSLEPLGRCNLPQLGQLEGSQPIGLTPLDDVGQAHESPFRRAAPLVNTGQDYWPVHLTHCAEFALIVGRRHTPAQVAATQHMRQAGNNPELFLSIKENAPTRSRTSGRRPLPGADRESRWRCGCRGATNNPAHEAALAFKRPTPWNPSLAPAVRTVPSKQLQV